MKELSFLLIWVWLDSNFFRHNTSLCSPFMLPSNIFDLQYAILFSFSALYLTEIARMKRLLDDKAEKTTWLLDANLQVGEWALFTNHFSYGLNWSDTAARIILEDIRASQVDLILNICCYWWSTFRCSKECGSSDFHSHIRLAACWRDFQDIVLK